MKSRKEKKRRWRSVGFSYMREVGDVGGVWNEKADKEEKDDDDDSELDDFEDDDGKYFGIIVFLCF